MMAVGACRAHIGILWWAARRNGGQGTHGVSSGGGSRQGDLSRGPMLVGVDEAEGGRTHEKRKGAHG